jgi:tyrosyl-tRNA synthetase
VLTILEERGFIKQATHLEPLRELLDNEKITAYVGFDPTADSLHVGHTVAVMALAHLQRERTPPYRYRRWRHRPDWRSQWQNRDAPNADS